MAARAAAVILAGGRGERLGGIIKANIEIGGVRLIDCVCGAVRGAEPILVARGTFSDAELRLPVGTIAVPDAGQGGPLTGVAGAVSWLSERADAPPFLLSVAVDTPFFPHAFLPAALEAIGEADAVVSHFGGQDYPTNALWRVAAVRPQLGGVRSLKRLLERVESRKLDWTSRASDDPFLNVNTPQDRAAMEQQASAHFGVGNAGQTR